MNVIDVPIAYLEETCWDSVEKHLTIMGDVYIQLTYFREVAWTNSPIVNLLLDQIDERLRNEQRE